MSSPAAANPRGAVSGPADAPRVLIIGPAGAGKSWLVGALARAAETQETILGGRFLDQYGGLRELRDQVYAGKTGSPIPEHVVRVEPITGTTVESKKAWPLVVVDGDGPQQLSRADAVMFVVDAASLDQLENDVVEFGRFLDQFRRERGRRADEPQLPVYLVLTQCDRLARPGDTKAVWSERLEMRKEEIGQRFDEYIQSQSGFGTLALSTAAVAAKHPPLTNAASRPDEPFGVAELFQQASTTAREHAGRKTRGEVGIRRMVVAAGIVVAIVAAFAAISPFFRNTFEASPAKAALTAYRHGEGPAPAGHLAAPLEPKIEQLLGIARDPTFGKLSESDRTFVTARLDELREYQNYFGRLKQQIDPVKAGSVEELQRVDQLLRSDLNLPAAYVSTWAPSEAGQLRDLWLKQVPALKSAAQSAAAAIDARRLTMDKLFVLGDTAPNWPEWAKKADDALSAGPPVKASDPLTLPTGQGPALTNAIVLAYPDVAKSSDRLAQSARRLAAFRAIAGVVGLVDDAGPTLKIPDGFTADQAPALWTALVAKYPDLVSWGSPDIPDAAMSAVQLAARKSYDRLVPSGRSLVRGAYGSPNDGPESPGRWRTAVEKLPANGSMKAWNELARLALRLAGENSDPLEELLRFVRKDEFVIELQAVDVLIPGGKWTPTGSWILFVQPPGGQAVKKSFRAPDDPKGERIRFTAADGKPAKIKPGDLVWAELGVTDKAKDDLQLTWWASGIRSKLYQMDRLSRVPRIHKLDQRAETGEVAIGVRVEFLPIGAVPRIPDLMPEMP
jgi:hypothetical protein